MHVVSSSPKKQLVSEWNWESQRARILNSVANSLEINISLLLGSSNYLPYVVKNAFSVFVNVVILKDSETKNALTRMIGTFPHLADGVSWAEKKYVDGSMASYLIRKIGMTSPKYYVGCFLVELGDIWPKLVSTNIGLLIPHFGGESYKMRNVLVWMLGKLVMKAFDDNEVEVWAKLCEEHSVSFGIWNEVVEHNPFGPQLRAASFEATLEQYKKNDEDGEVLNMGEEMNKEQDDSLTGSSLPHEEDMIGQTDDSVPDFGNLEQTRTLVALLEAGFRLSNCVFATMPTHPISGFIFCHRCGGYNSSTDEMQTIPNK
ncbi:hypothetical protein KY290_009485 [Solanum tuberosum]|uniref:Condensin complex subunit 1 N-terminal domain-containing protein n=1 Tax=Solanum tuberosum TaxID=4113 RepID=A0ABQ7WBI8_SOLTU|nr:hypothetical protein KY290_009485 [Solanum tuberosum]